MIDRFREMPARQRNANIVETQAPRLDKRRRARLKREIWQKLMVQLEKIELPTVRS